MAKPHIPYSLSEIGEWSGERLAQETRLASEWLQNLSKPDLVAKLEKSNQLAEELERAYNLTQIQIEAAKAKTSMSPGELAALIIQRTQINCETAAEAVQVLLDNKPTEATQKLIEASEKSDLPEHIKKFVQAELEERVGNSPTAVVTLRITAETVEHLIDAETALLAGKGEEAAAAFLKTFPA